MTGLRLICLSQSPYPFPLTSRVDRRLRCQGGDPSDAEPHTGVSLSCGLARASSRSHGRRTPGYRSSKDLAAMASTGLKERRAALCDFPSGSAQDWDKRRHPLLRPGSPLLLLPQEGSFLAVSWSGEGHLVRGKRQGQRVGVAEGRLQGQILIFWVRTNTSKPQQEVWASKVSHQVASWQEREP